MTTGPRVVSPSPGEPGTQTAPLGRTVALVLLAGVAAGALAWLGGEAFHDYFRPATRMVAAYGGGSSAAADGAALAVASTRNSTLVFGISGAALGLCFGLAGGLAGRVRAGTIRGGLVGLTAGGVVGAAAARLLIPVFWSLLYDERGGGFDRDGMLFPLLIHAGVNGAIGATGALAFAIGLGSERSSWPRYVLAGILGGMIAAVGLEIATVLFFPTVRTMHPIPPTVAGRLVDRLLLPLSVAAPLALAAFPRRAAARAAR